MKTPEERITRGTGNFIHCTDYEEAIQAMKEYAKEYHESKVKKLHLLNILKITTLDVFKINFKFIL